jgi:hypothetical protein
VKNKCGQCLFAEGGDKVKFKNGDTNIWFNCHLCKRENDIVFLVYDETSIVWEDQNACDNFESAATSMLIKRSDLDIIQSKIANEGYFQIQRKEQT